MTLRVNVSDHFLVPARPDYSWKMTVLTASTENVYSFGCQLTQIVLKKGFKTTVVVVTVSWKWLNEELAYSEPTKTHFFSSVCIDHRQQSSGQSKPDGTSLADNATSADRSFKVDFTQFVNKMQREQHLLTSTQTQRCSERLTHRCKYILIFSLDLNLKMLETWQNLKLPLKLHNNSCCSYYHRHH